jgi:hypothetical protein
MHVVIPAVIVVLPALGGIGEDEKAVVGHGAILSWPV